MFTNSLKSTLILALSATMFPLFSQAKAQSNVIVNKINEQKYTVSMTSFDGIEVNAKVQLPQIKQATYPVLISMHGMARSQNRVWQGEFNGSKTVEKTHEITEIALSKGIAVLAIDARFHGERKVEGLGLKDILAELENKQDENYKRMILDTVADYKAVISNLAKFPKLDPKNIHIVGYSMGAQMALLVAADVPEIKSVYAMVPPGISAQRASVSPSNNAHKIKKTEVILFTANQDQYSTQAENTQLFNNLATPNKLKVEFNSDHLLPESYVATLAKLWAI